MTLVLNLGHSPLYRHFFVSAYMLSRFQLLTMHLILLSNLSPNLSAYDQNPTNEFNIVPNPFYSYLPLEHNIYL